MFNIGPASAAAISVERVQFRNGVFLSLLVMLTNQIVVLRSASMYSAAPDRTHIPPLSLSLDVSVHVRRA